MMPELNNSTGVQTEPDGYQIAITPEFLEGVPSQFVDVLGFQFLIPLGERRQIAQKALAKARKDIPAKMKYFWILLVPSFVVCLCMVWFHQQIDLSLVELILWTVFLVVCYALGCIVCWVRWAREYALPVLAPWPLRQMWRLSARHLFRRMVKQSPYEVAYSIQGTMLNIQIPKLGFEKHLEVTRKMVAVRHRNTCIVFAKRGSQRRMAHIYFQDESQAAWIADFFEKCGCQQFNADQPAMV